MILFTFSSNNHESQRAWVKNQLEKRGKVTRNQCLNKYISRLASIISRLKDKGMDIKARKIGTDYEYYLEDK